MKDGYRDRANIATKLPSWMVNTHGDMERFLDEQRAKKAKFGASGWLKEHERASHCIECGACEDHCPQNISIREHLKKVAEK